MRKPWTSAEIRHASGMWKAGRTASDIANMLGRGEQSVKHKIRIDREAFPERNDTRFTGKKVGIKMTITPLLYRALKDEAAANNRSMNAIIKAALRDRFLRRIT